MESDLGLIGVSIHKDPPNPPGRLLNCGRVAEEILWPDLLLHFVFGFFCMSYRSDNMGTEPPTLHSSRQTNAYICVFITFTAATLTIALRLIARRLTKVSLWLDDYLATIAFLCAAVYTGLVIWWLQSGLGLFLNEINMPMEDILERSRLILWNAELLYAFSLASSKFAILGFYWRMFKTSNLKMPIQTLVGCTMIWVIVRTFLTIFHCIPIAKYWRPSRLGHCTIDDSKFFFGTVFVHFIIDVAILALPALEIRKLQLPLSQRLGIMAMFGFGIFVCVSSVVVMVLSVGYDTSSVEMPWHIAPIMIWATAEINLAIVSACLPMLRPIYLVVLHRPLTKNSSNAVSCGHSKSASRSLPATNQLDTLTSHKDVDKTETASIHEPANRSGSMTSRASDIDRGGHGNITVVGVGPEEDRFDGEPQARSKALAAGKGGERRGRDSRRSSVSNVVGEGSWNNLGGIMVTNEMSVRSDKVQ